MDIFAHCYARVLCNGIVCGSLYALYRFCKLVGPRGVCRTELSSMYMHNEHTFVIAVNVTGFVFVVKENLFTRWK